VDLLQHQANIQRLSDYTDGCHLCKQ